MKKKAKSAILTFDSTHDPIYAPFTFLGIDLGSEIASQRKSSQLP